MADLACVLLFGAAVGGGLTVVAVVDDWLRARGGMRMVLRRLRCHWRTQGGGKGPRGRL